MTTREVTTDIEMLERLAPPAGRDVVDIGCGGGALVRELTARGARVVGVEVSESQLAAALDRDDGRGARYVVGQAQQLPLDDSSADVAMFMRTLHHVPQPSMGVALREAGRVIRPDGIVYVAEPLTEGDFFELVSLVEDELEVRRAAQDALAGATAAGLKRATTIDYDVQVWIGDLAMLRKRVVSVDPERAAVFDARRAELADAFARLGQPGGRDGERCFVQPMRADVLRRARADESM
jgi:SAM-dependent methyltransferase